MVELKSPIFVKVLPARDNPAPAEYELLLSEAGVQAVPFHFRISLFAGAVVDTDFPCNATTVREVDPVASPKCAVCEKVFEDKVIPVPAANEVLEGVDHVPFPFKKTEAPALFDPGTSPASVDVVLNNGIVTPVPDEMSKLRVPAV